MSDVGRLVRECENCYRPWLEWARHSDIIEVQIYSRWRLDNHGVVGPEPDVELTCSGEERGPLQGRTHWSNAFRTLRDVGSCMHWSLPDNFEWIFGLEIAISSATGPRTLSCSFPRFARWVLCRGTNAPFSAHDCDRGSRILWHHFSGPAAPIGQLGPTRLILFERSPTFGTGAAYGSHAYPYLLNVPAGRMSAVTEDPDHLLDYARHRLAEVHADSYLTRAFYGEYLQHYLAQSEAAAPAHIQLERVRCEVTALHPLDLKGSVVVRAQGRQRPADQVVVAWGDPAPVPRRYAAEVQRHLAYSCQPFQSELTHPADRRVLIIGTGPTMADLTAATVAANPQVELIAVSRHGLLPQPQTVCAGPNVSHMRHPQFQVPPAASVRQIVSSVRTYVEAVRGQGLDWRDALVALRGSVPALWEGLGDADRRRFLRHVRTYWDIHRHRLAPELAARIMRLRASAQLRVHAGRILRLVADRSRISLHWYARGQSDIQQLSVDRILDCSGSDYRILKTRDPLLRHLLDAGVASIDQNALGLRTGAQGALINRDGDTAQQLFYLGPMLRASHWEATAVGELRQRVDSLAQTLRSLSARQPALRLRPSRLGFVESQPHR